MTWPTKKLDEVYAVKKFLDNDKVEFRFSQSNINVEADEPVDVFVKDINKKFQVVIADFEQYEILGKTKPIQGAKIVNMPPRTKKDVWREYILRPLQKKSKYGKSASGIILLIKAPFDPPWIKQYIIRLRESGYNQELKNLGFDAIYLVCSKKNIQIYP